MSRCDVEFSSGGTSCAAWLYHPGADGPLPLIVMAHGFSGTRELRLDAYAEHFSAAGIAALVFDYRHFGASGGEPRQLLDIGKQQADYHAAVSYARALDWVDPDRVAVFGSSFSGGHVIEVAAADQRIAALVSQCPFTDGIASTRVLPPMVMARGTVAGLIDQLGALAGRPPNYVPAIGAPGTFAVMTAPDAESGFRALVPAATRWENRVAARIMLRVPTYRPGKAAARVRCPALFCVTDGDSLAPAEQTVKLVSAAPRAEIRRYPVGHFEIYVSAAFERAVGDQTEFLARHLVAAPAPASR